MERLLVFLFLTASLLQISCSMDLAISNLHDEPTLSLAKPATAEIVSGSTQYELSNVRGYLVQASAGAVTSATYQLSTIRNYKMYQGVQGQMISEDPR